jgi:hypothetical protein
MARQREKTFKGLKMGGSCRVLHYDKEDNTLKELKTQGEAVVKQRVT